MTPGSRTLLAASVLRLHSRSSRWPETRGRFACGRSTPIGGRQPPEKSHWGVNIDDAVRDDHIVLLVRDDMVGAFVLSGQQSGPNATKIRWVFRKGLAGPLQSKGDGSKNRRTDGSPRKRTTGS